MKVTRLSVVLAALVAAALVVPLGAPGATKSVKPSSDFIDLKSVPKPKTTGAEIVAGLEDFVERFPLRTNGLPNNIAASEFLAEEAKKNGFKSRIIEFEVPGTPARTVRAVEAVKRGTVKPDEWIGFVAHYDSAIGSPPGVASVQGAYDDASGTNMVRFFGKEFSKIKTNRSIALLWFDAEENGLLASQAYVDMVAKKKQKFAAVFGFDMVGIGYPARYCICIYNGPMPEDAAWAVPIAEYVNFEFLKFPEGNGGPTSAEKWPLGTDGHICLCGPNIRNSDERNFAAAGYKTMRWTGMRTAMDYPGYHAPWDTVPFMEAVAGSRENLEMGTENTFVSAYYTTFVVDNL